MALGQLLSVLAALARLCPHLWFESLSHRERREAGRAVDALRRGAQQFDLVLNDRVQGGLLSVDASHLF